MDKGIIKLKKHQDIRFNSGHPWIYSNEIEQKEDLKNLPKGAIVDLFSHQGRYLGTGYYNQHSLVSFRLLTKDQNQKIDLDFFIDKIRNAFLLRRQFFADDFYRLVYSEADGLPGLVIDRFGNLFVCQITTAGMEALIELITQALSNLFPRAVIIFKNDHNLRKLENLPLDVKVAVGELKADNILLENNLKFYFDPINGQKTGWFYDQRENRHFVASLANGLDVLDAYCYNGGFGINAKKVGAKSVTFIDSSNDAINKVKANLDLNDLDQDAEFLVGEVFEEMAKLIDLGKKYQLIILDPPAFVKSKKDFFVGLKAYEKLARLACCLLDHDGYLFLASCSHHVNLGDLIKSSAIGINKSKRNARLIRVFGAGIDHPLHPFLQESEYLKSLIYKLD